MVAIYSDKLIELTAEGLKFRHFYFPVGAFTVPLTDIPFIVRLPNTLAYGRWRLHGSGDIRTWLPCDWRRPSRKAIYWLARTGRWCRIAFSVEHEELFEQAARTAGLSVEARLRPPA